MDYQRLNLLRTVPVLSRPFLKASLFATIGAGAYLGTVITFGGILCRRLGATPEMLFLMSIAPFIGFLLTTPVVRLAFRFRWGTLLGAMTVLGGLLLMPYAMVDSAFVFVLFLSLVRVVNGAKQVLTQALLRAHVHEIARPQALKWLRLSAFALMLPIAHVAGEVLDANQTHYKWLWPVVGLLMILTCIPYFRLPVRHAEAGSLRHHCSLFEELALLKRDKVFFAFLIVFFIGTFAEKINMPINAIYFADHLDLRYSEVGKALGIIGPLLAVGGFFFWAWTLKKIPPLVVLTLGMLLKSGRPLFWALAYNQAEPFWFVAAGEACFRFMISGIEMGALLTILQMSGQDRVPVYIGLHYVFMGIRGLIGPVIGLWLYKAGFPIQHIYWIVFSIVILGGLSLVGFGVRFGFRAQRAAGRVNSTCLPRLKLRLSKLE